MANTNNPEWDIKLIPDLTGKVALVTGANSSTGVGWNIAHQLALKGAKVYIGARSTEKAASAIAEIQKISPGSKLAPFVAELTDLRQLTASANAFVKSEERLDILVNNAGVLPRALDFDKHGISVSFTINHLAPFALTLALLPLLKKTAARHPGVRVVSLTSMSHKHTPATARFNSIEAFNNDFGGTDDMKSNYVRYGYSKLGNVLFARQLQKKFDAEGIAAISVSVHPGAVKTDGAINFAGEHVKMLDGTITPFQGAITPLYAATAPEVWAEKAKYGGGYIMPYSVLAPDEESALAKDPAIVEECWNTSEKVINDVIKA